MISSGLSRRSFLAGAAALAALTLPGCNTTSSPGPSTPSAPPVVDPLVAVLDRHVALRSYYTEALGARPELKAMLAPLRLEVDQHVTALAAAMAIAPPSASVSASATSVSRASSPASSPDSSTAAASTSNAPAVDPAAVIAELAKAESAAAGAIAKLIRTIAAQRAPLLGSIAASCACHVVVLGG